MARGNRTKRSEKERERLRTLALGTTQTEEHKRKKALAGKMIGNAYALGYRKKSALGLIEGYRNWQKNQWHHRNRAANGEHSFQEWEILKAQYNWICPCCKKREPEIKLTEDHIIPLSKGGSNNIENIQPLCRSCNCKKLTKIIKY